ncbi:MAG: diphosphomevalonate decarboxylase [Bacteroidetes bacterium]|nr:MAG: diphosphomevalonate decarboxylase [Bacteroidota bacterium]
MIDFQEKYKQHSEKLVSFPAFKGKRTQKWQSPSNIALIKYWGKKDDQIPQNPSLSFTLSSSFTKTEIIYEVGGKPGISIQFLFEGKHNPGFEKRITKHLHKLAIFLPFIKSLNLTINSSNSFPHSSGIASSASSMSALALGLCSIERDLFGTLTDEKEFYQKASFLARLCSGSAARSVYGGFTVWGKNEYIPNSSNEIAIPLKTEIHPVFHNLNDSILITSPEKKSVSSSQGHSLMNGHAYEEARYNQAQTNFHGLSEALKTGDEKKFITIVENEALSLHALMMASNPGFTLLNQNTWNIIHAIRKFRKKNNMMLAFTLDAGPNVHLIYPEKNKKALLDFINDDLIKYCHGQKWIDDGIGSGPVQI